MPPPRWLRNLAVHLTGNDRAQRFLLWSLDHLLNLMGMGPGGFLVSSGEEVLLEKLRERHKLSALPLCIFDVGAHHGEFSSSLIQPLTAAGIPFTLHIFEPSRASYQVLREKFKDQGNVSLNNFALGGKSGQASLFSDGPGSPLSSLSLRRLDHFDVKFSHVEPVEVRTLDEYCSQQPIEALDLLKLDVEGHELEAMQGGLRMFRERRVAMMSFEFGGTDIDSKTFFQDIWYFIKDNAIGRMFRMTPSGHLVAVTEYLELYEQFRPTNYLVLREEN